MKLYLLERTKCMTKDYNVFTKDKGHFLVRVPNYIQLDNIREDIRFLYGKPKDDERIPGKSKWNSGHLMDKVKFIISQIAHGLKEETRPDGSVVIESGDQRIDSQYMEDIMDDYYKLKKFLMNQKYIQCDNISISGQKCFAYKLNIEHPSFIPGQTISYTYDILGSKITKQIRKANSKFFVKQARIERTLLGDVVIMNDTYDNKIKEDEKFQPIYTLLEESLTNSGLKINDQEFQEFLEEYINLLIAKLLTPTKSGQFKRYDGMGLRFGNLAILIGELIKIKEDFNQYDRFSRSNKNLRISSSFTRLPKVIRHLVRTKDDEKLASIDLVASQPFFLSTILQNSFYSSTEWNSYNLKTIYPRIHFKLIEDNNIGKNQKERTVFEIYDEFQLKKGIQKTKANGNSIVRPMMNIGSSLSRGLQSSFQGMVSGANVAVNNQVYDLIKAQAIKDSRKERNVIRPVYQIISEGKTRSIDTSIVYLNDQFSSSISNTSPDIMSQFGKPNSLLPGVKKDFYALNQIPKQYQNDSSNLKLVPCKSEYFFVDYMANGDLEGIDKYVNFDFAAGDFFTEVAKNVPVVDEDPNINYYQLFSEEEEEDYFEEDEAFQLRRKKTKGKMYTFLFDWKPKNREHNELVSAIIVTFPGLSHLVENIQNKLTPKQFAYLLQRTEAHVMIDRVCKEFLLEHPKAPIITLHDGIFTTEEYIDRLEAFTKETVNHVTKKTPGIKKEKPVPSFNLSEDFLNKIKNSKIIRKPNKQYLDKNIQKYCQVGLEWLRDNFTEDKYLQIFQEAEEFYRNYSHPIVEGTVDENGVEVKQKKKNIFHKPYGISSLV